MGLVQRGVKNYIFQCGFDGLQHAKGGYCILSVVGVNVHDLYSTKISPDTSTVPVRSWHMVEDSLSSDNRLPF